LRFPKAPLKIRGGYELKNRTKIKIEVSRDVAPISKEYISALSKTIRKWKKILRLQDWEIRVQIVSPEVIEKGYIADVSANYVYLQALIRISSDAKVEWFDSIISHELLHIRIGVIRDKIRYLGNRITQQEYKIIMEAEENVVETLSRILCELFKVDNYHSKNPNTQRRSL